MLGVFGGEVRLSTGAAFIHRSGGSAVVAAKVSVPGYSVVGKQDETR